MSKEVYEQYTELFGTNKPMLEQFFIYVKNVIRGDFGLSFSQYPRTVADILKSSIWWTICLQFPAIIVGWMIGNTLGALAAYLKKGFDKVLMPISIFVSNFPAFGMAVILLVIFAVRFKWFPTSGGYGFDLIPTLSWKFIWSVIVHYQLPFWSIVLIAIGGQAIGMRSMSIYELNADYVKYAVSWASKIERLSVMYSGMPCCRRSPVWRWRSVPWWVVRLSLRSFSVIRGLVPPF